MAIIYSEHIRGKLTHWARKEFAEVINSSNHKHTPQIWNKPEGIWLSWNGGWEKWCNDEGMEKWIGPDKICWEADLMPARKIWLIDSLQDFMDIWLQFNPDPTKATMLGLIHLQDGKFWAWLKEQGFHGIAMTESGQWATRMTTFLYGWDCQCIVMFDKADIILRMEGINMSEHGKRFDEALDLHITRIPETEEEGEWYDKHIDELEKNFIEANNDAFLDFMHTEYDDNRQAYDEEPSDIHKDQDGRPIITGDELLTTLDEQLIHEGENENSQEPEYEEDEDGN